jgi:hypothetical protein
MAISTNIEYVMHVYYWQRDQRTINAEDSSHVGCYATLPGRQSKGLEWSQCLLHQGRGSEKRVYSSKTAWP